MRHLGSKIEKMEKLDANPILKEVHEAAENLQKKIDQGSYLLVKSERWEIGNRPQELLGLGSEYEQSEENMNLGFKSLSEAVLDLRSMPSLIPNSSRNELISNGNLRKEMRWPSCYSLDGESIINVDEIKTYESASSLSLATFASLLIEFVARLQNLVDAIEELSEKAAFRDVIRQRENGCRVVDTADEMPYVKEVMSQ